MNIRWSLLAPRTRSPLSQGPWVLRDGARPTCQSRTRQALGFTLIEVMLVVGIIGIISAMALNYSGPVRRRLDLKKLSREVFSALSVGRNEAIKQSKTVTIAFGGSTRFEAFIDTNSNSAYDVGEALIYQYPTSPGVYMSGMQLSSSGLSPAVLFNANGFCVDSSGNFRSGTVTVTDSQPSPSETKTIDITIGGGLRIQ